MLKRVKKTGHQVRSNIRGIAAEPITIRSESSAAASSNDDSEAATSASSSDFERLSKSFHYSDGYSSEDSSSDN